VDHKAALRTSHRIKRTHITQLEWNWRNALLCDQILRWLDHRAKVRHLLLYFGTRREAFFCSADFFSRIPKNIETYLPRIHPTDRTMEFAKWRHGEPLLNNRYGIPEPVSCDLWTSAMSANVSAAIIPALAVDVHGVRLGAGGGYYDRWLASNRSPSLTTAVPIFEAHIEDCLPREKHDETVDWIISEAAFFASAK
jgi:5,10-methenyltetrahydrofolate synthetase